MENQSERPMRRVPPHAMVFGIGNPYRRDDAIGALLAAQLGAVLSQRGWRVTLQCVHQLTPDIAEAIAEENPDGVIFADVDATGAPPTLTAIKPTALDGASSHAASPGFVLLLAQRLFACTAPGFLITIPGFDFDHGEGVSPLAQQSLGQAPELVDNFIAALFPHK